MILAAHGPEQALKLLASTILMGQRNWKAIRTIAYRCLEKERKEEESGQGEGGVIAQSLGSTLFYALPPMSS